jgi:YD repeat-containing protein
MPNGVETLTQVGANWELQLADDTIYVFNSTGRLDTIQYRGGYVQTLDWDANGKNIAVTDNLGRSLTFAYGANGLLSQMTDADGHVTQYTYIDKSGAVAPGVTVASIENALDTVIYPDATPSDTDNPRIQYLYENTSLPYALTGIIDERGVRYASWTYDGSGRAASSEHAGGVEHFSFAYDTVNSKTTVTNPLGKDTVYHFNQNVNGVSLLTQIEGIASPNCAASNTDFGYDANLFVNQVTDGEGRITAVVNNTRGLPTSVTRGSGTPSAATTSYSWDASFRVPSQVVQPGLTTDLTWSLGRLTLLTQTDTTTTTIPYPTNGQTRTWRFAYYAPGLLASVDGPLAGSGDMVRYRYNNGNGFIQTVTNELGQLTEVTAWDARGNPKTIIDPNGVVSTLTYDERGRFTSVTVDPGGLAGQTAVAYNAAGDIAKITRPERRVPAIHL